MLGPALEKPKPAIKNNSELIRLSASRISCLDTCSMVYFYKYCEKICDSTNRGSERGDICHLIFEVLGNPRHFNKYIKKIVKEDSIVCIPSLKRLIEKRAKRHKLDLTQLVEPISKKNDAIDTLTCIDEMILVGIKTDFLDKDKKLIKREFEFDITSQSPRYRIMGYIDGIFENGNTIEFSDFKSSKKRFSDKELQDNIQALTYLLAARTLYKNHKKRKARFIMLRFPDKPIQELDEVTDEKLDGFEYHLESISEFMRNFTFEDAQRKTQAHLTRKRGGGLCHSARTGHRCAYLDPFDYWQMIDDKGNPIKSVREESKIERKSNCLWVKKRFDGCHMWKNDRPAPFNS